jgi:hypothetical protein
MPGNDSPTRIASLERDVLRTLCAWVGAAAKWEAVNRSLSSYAWQEPEHKVVYEALRRIRSRSTKAWRDQLPAQATRMGFPDVDWQSYLDANETPLSQKQLEELIRDLKTSVASHG